MTDPAPRVRARGEDPVTRTLTLSLDDGATFEVALDAPEARSLQVGDEVGAPERAALEAAAERKEVARVVFRLLDRRLYTRGQLRERLIARGLGVDPVETVLDQFARGGLVDDARFAGAYCRDQLAQRPVGPHYLRRKLRAAGVEDPVAEVAVEAAISDEAQLARLALARRRFAWPQDRPRALRFLQSRGFSRRVATAVVLDAGAGPAEEIAGSD